MPEPYEVPPTTFGSMYLPKASTLLGVNTTSLGEVF
jgi:hypothetical protein